MHKETDILKDHVPSPLEITEYEQKWNTLADYVNQENALNKLFFNLCPENKEMSDILIKCSSLNDFYSTNIFKVHNVAKHFLNPNRSLETELALFLMTAIRKMWLYIVVS